MEKSPLQLMSRMASVVKGQYQATKQMDDVVEPNAGEKAAADRTKVFEGNGHLHRGRVDEREEEHVGSSLKCILIKRSLMLTI